jgi:hypothetical protein
VLVVALLDDLAADLWSPTSRVALHRVLQGDDIVEPDDDPSQQQIDKNRILSIDNMFRSKTRSSDKIRQLMSTYIGTNIMCAREKHI